MKIKITCEFVARGQNSRGPKRTALKMNRALMNRVKNETAVNMNRAIKTALRKGKQSLKFKTAHGSYHVNIGSV